MDDGLKVSSEHITPPQVQPEENGDSKRVSQHPDFGKVRTEEHPKEDLSAVFSERTESSSEISSKEVPTIVEQVPTIPTFDDSERLSSIKAYLQSQKVIRVGVPDAPNLGHQSAALTVISELRKYGYEGVIEIVCDDRSNRREDWASSKLEKLLPGYVRTDDIVEMPDQKIKVICLREGMEMKQDSVEIGIYGACDDFERQVPNKTLNAKTVLVLQPHQWHQPRFISVNRDLSLFSKLVGKDPLKTIPLDEASRKSLFEGEDNVTELRKSHLTYHLDVEPPADLNHLVQSEFGNQAEQLEKAGNPEKAQATREKASTVMTLFESVDAGKIDMMMTYGLDMDNSYRSLVSGIKYAQDNGVAKGTVLLITGHSHNLPKPIGLKELRS